MICTSVIPCLPSGLAKNNKIMSTFLLFSQFFFSYFESLFFFRNRGDKPYSKAVKLDILVNFSKVQQKCQFF